MGKIGNNFEFVASVKGKSETQKGNKPVVVLTLKEKDGKEFDWTSFDVGGEWDAVKRDDVIKVNAYLAENANGKWPFKNLDSLVATDQDPKDIGFSMMSDAEGKLFPRGALPAYMTESQNDRPAGHGRGTGNPDDRSISIERQSSVNAAAKVIDIIASHYSEHYTDLTQVLTHAEENLPQYLRLADSFYEYYSNRATAGGLESIEGINQAGQPITIVRPIGSVQGHSKPSEWRNATDPYEPPKLENVGHVLYAAHKRWGLSQSKVCDFFGVDEPTDVRNSYTFSEAWEALKANYDGPDGRE